MEWTANIAVHESASPDFLREQIGSALKRGSVHPHLLYSGLRQASLWTALHHAVSPAQRDETCVSLYDEAFRRATASLQGNVAHVVSLACGDGTKDARCLREIRRSNRAVIYTPVDISLDLVLSAARHAGAELRGLQSTPLVCDLARCSVLPAILKGFDPSGAERILLFLGTIHNFWPPDILRSILYPLRAQDQLLISANLAPQERYEEGLQAILSQYDNAATRRWLRGALSELDLTEQDGDLRFRVAVSPDPTLKRIEAEFVLRRDRRVSLFGMEHELRADQVLSVFFSHRFTPEHMRQLLERSGLRLVETWIGAGGEEGLFLCKRAG